MLNYRDFRETGPADPKYWLHETPQSAYFFFCFVDVGATLIEACTSLGVTGILTEFTLVDAGSNGIPRELLAGRPFKPLGGVDRVLKELPVKKKIMIFFKTNFCFLKNNNKNYKQLYV